ncbi:phage protein [Frateuria aurantia]|uniref:Uncharacterized protein n=1 Tax=Frateuria aurantia (strain ATCC 33424 / DSM 6220 / KCTC 2777 / LMG 1558 / NBRC 3245 / NCIMB 13370) TaxID=767434 RepID=H8L680_FRAAD|nr:hypothetical protein [Frateuria aurantia]AFC85924.1 hypothetical protein Fraau_1504 [Frateuria aurantia DSM 6220]
MSQSAQQYLRQVQLVIGTPGGPAVDVSDLRVTFNVRSASVETLKSANIRIFNLAKATASKVLNEFTYIELHAGYPNNMGMIFRGEICQVKYGRDQNMVDTVTEILAQDADTAYNQAVISKTLAKGWTYEDQFSALMRPLNKYGVNPGFSPSRTNSPAPRGITMYGMVRDEMRILAEDMDCDWIMEDGFLHLIPSDGYIPGNVPVINGMTGMVGIPMQTIEGIEVQCLLNPLVKAGGAVKLNNAEIAKAANRVPTNTTNGLQPVAGLDADGFYRVACVTHTGDTRGQQFYTYIIGYSVDPNQARPMVGPSVTAVPG